MQLANILRAITLLIIATISYWTLLLIMQGLRALREKSQQISKSKSEIAYLRGLLQEAVMLRNDWFSQVNPLRRRLGTKKLTEKQKNQREELRRQGLRCIRTEVELRNIHQDKYGDHNLLGFFCELKRLIDDLSDEYRYT